MAGLGATSTDRARMLAQERILPATKPTLPLRESTAKRWLVSFARKLHEEPLAFPLMVKAFRALQNLGISLTPNHFYWPVPDVAELEKRTWPEYTLPGHGFHIADQARLARKLASSFGEELVFSRESRDDSYHYNNGYFEAVDAEIAYGFVRSCKPAHILEIGAGYSTRVLAAALERNAEHDGVEGRLVSIDPNTERLPSAEWSDRVEQIPRAVQDIDLEFFDLLRSGDILFIDSSHVVATGSDVTREYLQVLPRLRRGVLVHVHDIFLPFDYPRDAVLNKLWFWSEQYLLQAFLSFNTEFEVLWGSSAMQAYCPFADRGMLSALASQLSRNAGGETALCAHA